MATPKLIILSEIARGQTYELTDDTYTIGRVESAGICIPDATVSSAHCELTANDDGSYVARDLGSTNGTRVNGVRITEQALVNSDILQVGEIEVMYDCEEQSLTSVLSTQTGIDLHDTAGGVPLGDLGNLDRFKKGGRTVESKKTKVVWISVITTLVIIVIVLTAILMKNFYN